MTVQTSPFTCAACGQGFPTITAFDRHRRRYRCRKATT